MIVDDILNNELTKAQLAPIKVMVIDKAPFILLQNIQYIVP